MQKLLLISLLAFAANPASATETGHCDSKPFTLKKPAAPTAPPKTEVAQAKPVAPPAPAPTPRPKPKVTIGCKQPAAK